MEQEEKKERKKIEEKSFDKMTVKDLREVVKEIPGITGVHAMKKEELLTILHKEVEDKKALSKGKEKKEKVNMTVKDLKKMISGLREKKEAAREARDRKTVNILRHRISRLKKQTRKVAQG